MLSFKKGDYSLLLISVFILVLSLLTIGSVSPDNFINQVIFIIISLFIFFLFFLIDLEILFSISPIIYLFVIILLGVTFLVGYEARGSTRWISIGGFNIQPAEITKPFYSLILGRFWSRKNFNYKTLLICLLFSFPVFVLVFFQPDLGSTLSILSIFLGALFSLEINKKQLLLMFFSLLLLFPLVWLSLQDYQKKRIIHFLNPYTDPLGEGYHLIQSKITVGSGGIFGRGLGRGTQSHLYFLPERHTDFAFASFAEELGLIGISVLFFLYFLFFRKIILVVKKTLNHSGERSYMIVSLGILFYLFFQTVENIGMNMGILPITGITLPLFSYGGSSLLSTFISLGIISNISSKFGKKEESLYIG